MNLHLIKTNKKTEDFASFPNTTAHHYKQYMLYL